MNANETITAHETAIAHEDGGAAKHLLTQDQYRTFCTQFLAAAHAKNLSAADMLLRNWLLGKNLLNGFTAITNKNKLNNGAHPWLGAQTAHYWLVWTIEWAQRREAQRYWKSGEDQSGLDLLELKPLLGDLKAKLQAEIKSKIEG